LGKFIPEMSTHNDLLLQRLNWYFRGDIERISWLQNVYGKLGKVRKKPQFMQRNSRGFDAHKGECAQVGALKMHDAQWKACDR
jgi:hypothetical protein